MTHENSLEVPFETWNWKGFSLCNLAMACFCFCAVAFSRLAGYADLVNNTKSQRHGGFHKPMKWISYVPLFKTTASAPPTTLLLLLVCFLCFQCFWLTFFKASPKKKCTFLHRFVLILRATTHASVCNIFSNNRPGTRSVTKQLWFRQTFWVSRAWTTWFATWKTWFTRGRWWR